MNDPVPNPSTAGDSGPSSSPTPGGRVDTTRLQRMARAFCESAVLWAALDLRLFTRIAEGARSIDEVAAACGISALNAERLVACCLALDLLRVEAPPATPSAGLAGVRVVNSPESERFLVHGQPGYAGAWMTFTRPDVDGWMQLTELLRSLEPPRRLGMYADLTVDAARAYHRATASVGMGAGRRFCRHVDLSGRRHLLDLGGGSGAYSINAVRAFPGLRATVFDLPPVVVVTREYLEEHGVADVVGVVGGDFTADPLPRCDAVVMASNLPIYGDDVIAAVVRAAFDALEPGGEMHLIGEMLNDDGAGPLDASLWGMQEALYGSGGKAHTQAQVRGYFDRAGFVDVAESDFVPGILVRVSGSKPA